MRIIFYLLYTIYCILPTVLKGGERARRGLWGSGCMSWIRHHVKRRKKTQKPITNWHSLL